MNPSPEKSAFSKNIASPLENITLTIFYHTQTFSPAMIRGAPLPPAIPRKVAVSIRESFKRQK